MKKPLLKKCLPICLLATFSLLTACDQMGTKSFNKGESDYLHNNYGKAFPELLRAANDGNASAQYAVGYMYYRGIGVASNPGLGMMWIRKSAAQGYPKAIQALSAGGPSHASMMPAAGGVSHGYSSGGGDEGSASSGGGGGSSRASGGGSSSRASGGGASGPKAPKKELQVETVKHEKSAAEVKTQSTDTYASPDSVGDVKDTVYGTQGANDKGLTQFHARNSSLSATSMQYALQLFGDYDRHVAEKFVKKNHLEAFAKIYKTDFKGKSWYVVLDGNYPSVAHAKNAMDNLSGNLLKMHPWVRPVNGSLHG